MQELQEDLMATIMFQCHDFMILCHDDLTKMAKFLILIRKDFIQGVLFIFIVFYSDDITTLHMLTCKIENAQKRLDLSQVLVQMQSGAFIANCGTSFRSTPLGLNVIQPE